MPWYDGNIPALWETALERKTGAKIAVEVVYDPNGAAIQFDGLHDISGIDEIISERELDADYARRGVIQDLKLTFNDPDDYFSPKNTASPFHLAVGELDGTHSAGATSIKVLGWPDVAFGTNEALIIDDGTNREEIIANAFAAASGSTYYHVVTYSAGLAHDFAAGTRIFSAPVIGKEVFVKLANYTETTPQKLVVYRGKIVKDAETARGYGALTLSDARKAALDSTLAGADSAAGTKLMCIGSDGVLQSSITWSDSFNVPPITYSITAGTLPPGLALDRDTGEVAGAPTTAGDYTFTVTVTNGNGESISQECSMTIYAGPANTEFDGDLGLGDFEKDYLPDWNWYLEEPEIVSDKLRLEFDGQNIEYFFWHHDAIEQRYHVFAFADSPTSGDFTLEARIDAANMPSVPQLVCGIAVRFSNTGGLVFGYNQNNGQICLYDTDAGSRYSVTSGMATELDLRIRKVGGTYYYDFKTPSASSWTNLGSRANAGTVEKVGASIATDDDPVGTMTGYIDYDFMRLYAGTLTVNTTALSKTRTGHPYSQALHATGGAGSYVWSMDTGLLPRGLELDAATGVISGIVLEEINRTFTVKVTDGAASTDTQELTITVDNSLDILPDYFSYGLTGAVYSGDVAAFIGGTLDRSQVTVYSGCPLGRWTVSFTAPTIFTITGPSVSATAGNTAEDFDLPGWIKIPAAAWGYGMQAGDELTFVTGISYVNQNVVSVLYDLLSSKMGIAGKYIDASSFWAAKVIGNLYEAALTGASSIKVAIDTNIIISSLWIVNLNDGVNSQNLFCTAVAAADSFPPYVTISFGFGGTLSHDFGTDTVITLAKSNVPLAGRSFDEEYQYCHAMDYIISITLDREMSVMQALEAVGAHADIFTFHDFGMECVHAIRPRPAGTPKELTEAEIKGDVEASTLQLVNEVEIKYAYDYTTDDYQQSYVYPETDAANKSYQVYDQKIRTVIYAPGIYSSFVAKSLAQRKYMFWQNGQRLVDLNIDLMGVLFRLGERIQVNIDDPDIDAEVEITKKSLSVLPSKNVAISAFDVAHLKRFALVGVDGVDTGKLLW